MEQTESYLALLAIIVTVGTIFRNSTVPISLLLVITGMIISFVPGVPHVQVNANFILDIFLPLLLYNASAYSSTWRELKKDFRPVILLSIGHVVFITVLIAVVIHYLIPELGWPLAFVLGAVISPPDDVAIIAIAEKIQMPKRIVTVLKGEAMLNDATALVLFRFALIAALTHHFSPVHAVVSFFGIIVCETAYGLLIGYLSGNLRLLLKDPTLQMMVSILTPFVAYLPAEKLGGSGVVSTVVTGLFVGHAYWERYSADTRLTARSIWTTLEFAVQSILFLLVGLNFRFTLENIASIPLGSLILYSSSTVLAVILGRFAWVYLSAYLLRYLIPSIRQYDPYPPWQYPFVVSWAGMRGGISLAAAMIVPSLPIIGGINPKDLLIFLVFCVIVATLLIQGLTLPYILRALGMTAYGDREKRMDDEAELRVRTAMTNAVLSWLSDYKREITHNPKLSEEITLDIEQYKTLQSQLTIRLKNQTTGIDDGELSGLNDAIFLSSRILDIEREVLLRHWEQNKIDQAVKNKLEEQLDLRVKHLENIR
ncbi:MAG: Na+/H+ antiporter [Gammaproteobacteria bacterium]|nr:Na+/H+ antiporter [Gammaproteobacteria bacterium]